MIDVGFQVKGPQASNSHCVLGAFARAGRGLAKETDDVFGGSYANPPSHPIVAKPTGYSKPMDHELANVADD